MLHRGGVGAPGGIRHVCNSCCSFTFGAGTTNPGGYLFARRPGSRLNQQSEGWEVQYYVGFLGAMALCGIGLALKPETDLYEWAREEISARRQKRLREHGVNEE